MGVAQQDSVFTLNWYDHNLVTVDLWVKLTPFYVGGGQIDFPFDFFLKLYKNRKTFEFETLLLFYTPRDQGY